MIRKLPNECLEFRKRVWKLQMQIHGFEPFPKSGVIRTNWLQKHRDECEKCKDWLDRGVGWYGDIRKKFGQALEGFAGIHGFTIKDVAWRLRLWHDNRKLLRRQSRGKRFIRLIRDFRCMADNMAMEDFRTLLVDWLEQHDRQ